MVEDKAALIRQVPLFADLHRAEVDVVAAAVREVTAAPGDLLFAEGDPGDRLFVIVSGKVEVLKSLGSPDERMLAVREAGEFFGEMSLFEPDGRRTAAVRAMTPLHLLEMQRADFEQLLHHDPAVAYQMVRTLSLRLNHSHNTTIADLREKNHQLALAYAELKAAQAQLIEKERLEKELETARWIQRSILPSSLPGVPGYDLGAFLMPARAVGGDLYDFIPLPDHRLGVVIGDVSDKGVPAAIFMALTYSLLRAEAVRWESPSAVLQATNRHLLGMNEAGMFVTVLYGVLDSHHSSFLYARAGHEVPMRLDPSGKVEAPQRGRGQPLGLFDAPDLDERSIGLPPGSVLLMYTDGATDLTDPQGTRFGLDRLREAVCASRAGTAQAICDRVWDVLDRYRGSSAQFDDVALLAIQASR
ncbi:MAG TPA: SpoIIE family protein phosphatase [Anaerolineae bacterium]|nr:SpoIIE family protein phosphatase [Anaerolineae bacterium]